MKITNTSAVAVIGAGIAGLTCAQALLAAGLRPVLFEKSRGVGGRLATRRTQEGLTFDHGAQFFTANGDDFREFVSGQTAAGHISPWPVRGSGHTESGPWMVGTPSMNAPLKAITASLDIRFNTEITGINHAGDGWYLNGPETSGDQFFDAVVVTAPAPQAARLIGAACPSLTSAIRKAGIAPCWAMMFAFPEAGAARFDVWQDRDEAVSWICRNSSKPGREGPAETWVAHASAGWSMRHLELSPQEVLDMLRPVILGRLGREGRLPSYEAAHRWRYARVTQPIGEAFLHDPTGTLLTAGDWCLGPRVEYAHQSGLAAARFLLS